MRYSLAQLVYFEQLLGVGVVGKDFASLGRAAFATYSRFSWDESVCRASSFAPTGLQIMFKGLLIDIPKTPDELAPYLAAPAQQGDVGVGNAEAGARFYRGNFLLRL